MLHSPWVFVGLAILALEVVVLFAAPTLLAKLAFVRLAAERRILVRIDMALDGNDVVLTARQAWVPITLPLAALAMGVGTGGGADDGGWIRALMFLSIAMGVFSVQQLFLAGARDQALLQAFDVIEDEIRREHPAPKKKKKKKMPSEDAAQP